MKLIDGIKLKGKPAEIPDCGRDDLPEFFKEMGYKVGAEIGTHKGRFSEKLCRTGLKIYTIDPWLSYEDYSVEGIPQTRLDSLFNEAKQRLKPYPNCVIVRKTSMEAVKDFEDGSLDFVYIDGHHGFKYVAEDLWEWEKKVKKGGIISGHDYSFNDKNARDPYAISVKYVLDAFIECFRIETFYVLAGIERREKRSRSWMWVKE
jgi:hypothetical protein